MSELCEMEWLCSPQTTSAKKTGETTVSRWTIHLENHGKSFPWRKWLIVALMLGIAAAARAQVTGSILYFEVTNYTGYVIAGDTNSGGRQAIRTSTGIFYTNTSTTSETYDFQLAYRLLDSNFEPAPILDENGQTNTVYSVFQTNTLPEYSFSFRRFSNSPSAITI